MAFKSLKQILAGKFDDRGYSNEESIAYLQIQKPEEINPFITHHFGKDSGRFPLLFMTEGQGKRGMRGIDETNSSAIGTTQWTWKVTSRLEFTDMVTYFNDADTTPGLGGREFEVHFSTHRFINNYTIKAPDGTQVRIQADLGESPYGYAYLVRLIVADPKKFVNPANLKKGKYWSLGAPIVSESFSKGNRTNVQGYGTMTSQLEFRRFTKTIAGNVGNTVINYQMDDGNGKKSNLWINEELRQFNINMRVANEEALWEAQYNRNANGEILLKDRENGLPIPRTSGMLEICKEANYDTYGDTLTISKIKRTIGDVISDSNDDAERMNIVLMAGKGFAEDFDDAIKKDAKDNGFLTPLGDKEIRETANGLEYGAYFRAYKTIEGHTVIVKHCNYFDKGTSAEADRKNGNIHPRTGLPISSHKACLIDFSTYNGIQNVRLVHQKGRRYHAAAVEGMTKIPASFGLPENSINRAANDVDASSFEIMTSIGLQVDRPEKQLLFECVL